MTGDGVRQAKYDDINVRVGIKESDDVRPWLAGFVAAVGRKKAERLLRGVGKLEPVSRQGNATTQQQQQQQKEVYKVGDVVQANYRGDGHWFWAEVSAVHANGFYSVHYAEDCNEEFATWASRLRRNGTAEDSKEYDFDIAALAKQE